MEWVCAIGCSVTWVQLEMDGDGGRAGMRYKIISTVNYFGKLISVMGEIRGLGGDGCFVRHR